MSNNYFRFKQFTIYQDRCGMKVGMDGVTLGAWTKMGNAENILDIGTGTGLIALMLAQRTQARITGIDIEKECVLQAVENVAISPWKDRIAICQTSLQDFAASSPIKFDAVVCNPPFFVNSLKPLTDARIKARHTDTLSRRDLVKCTKQLLGVGGKLFLILPIDEEYRLLEAAKTEKLFCTKKTILFPNFQKAAKRILLQLEMVQNKCETDRLTVEEARHKYTPEYSKLLKEYYLNL
ncbi:MAG: tRNA1(Val) (adenine(37)-N6)-methyltransferase [Paludibacteraceae bacterium]